MQQTPRPLDIGLIHFEGIWYPEPVVGSHVQQRIATAERRRKCLGIAEVTGHKLSPERQMRRLGGGPYQEPQACAPFRREPGHMGSHKAGCPRDEEPHA